MSPQRLFHFNFKGCERTFTDEIKNLIVLQNNDDVKSIIKDIPPSDLVDTYGVSLLHLAVKYRNYNLIKFLVNLLDCNINAEDLFGITPIQIGLASNDFLAIDALLFGNTNSAIKNFEHMLTILLMKKDTMSEELVTDVLRNLIDRCMNPKAVIEVLTKTNCSIYLIVRMRYSYFTSSILKENSYKIEQQEYLAALIYAIKMVDLGNLKILWQFNYMKKYRKTFLDEVIFWMSESSPYREYIEPFFNHVTDWIIFDMNFIHFLHRIFLESNRSFLEILLLKCNVDLQVKNRFKFDVLPMIFGNEQEGAIELALKRQFNVNSESWIGMRPLHFAVHYRLPKNVDLLLDLGADCNAKDDQGRTPLFLACDKKCFEILLLRGANLQANDNRKQTIFEKENINDVSLEQWSLMLAQLALDHCCDVPIKPEVCNKIESAPTLISLYHSYFQQIRNTMNHQIAPAVTLFTILTKKPEEIPHCIESQASIQNILQIHCRMLYPFYYQAVSGKLSKVFNVYQAKCYIAAIISDRAKTYIDFKHLVLEKVFSYLTYKDITMLLRSQRRVLRSNI